MSAFLLSNAHINFMVNAGMKSGSIPHDRGLSWWYDGGNGGSRRYLSHHDRGRSQEVGTILQVENLKSLTARYPRDGDNLGAVLEEWGGTPYLYQHSPNAPTRDNPELWAGRVFNAIDCYSYQSCEHAGWEASEANAICNALKSAWCRMLPSYEEAPWGIDDPAPKPVTPQVEPMPGMTILGLVPRK